MYKLIKTIVVLFLCVLFSFQTLKASSMLGGEMTWTCVGKDSFLVKVVIYKVCTWQTISNPLMRVICSANNSQLSSFYLSNPSSVEITSFCTGACYSCQSSGCPLVYGIVEHTFIKLIDLSNAGSCCKLTLTVQAECCWANVTTLNAANKAPFIDAQLNRCLNPCDHSPKFTNPPLTIICVGQDVVFNHGVIDENTLNNGGLSDSLSYEWTPVLESLNNPISYTGQYTFNHPVYYWGFKNSQRSLPLGFHLNEENGDIAFRPIQIEQTIMALKVTEWRRIDGIMQNIGYIKRLYHVKVIDCPQNTSPTLSGPYFKAVYASDTVNFNIYSDDADTSVSTFLKMSWNKSIANATWSDNTGVVLHPIGHFRWIPSIRDISDIPYLFTVKVSDDICTVEGQANRAYQVLVCHKPEGTMEINKVSCNSYLLKANIQKGVVALKWYVNNNFVSDKNNYELKIQHSGRYDVKLELCGKNYPLYLYDTIDIPVMINAHIPNDTTLCKGDSMNVLSQIRNAQGNVSYLWNTGDTTSTLHIGPLYQDTLITLHVQDSLSCHSDTLLIKVDQFKVKLSQDTVVCPGFPSVLLATPLYDEGQQVKSFFWKDLSCNCPKDYDDSLTIYQPGVFSCLLENEYGCKITDTIIAVYHKSPEIKLSNQYNKYDFCSCPRSIILYCSPVGGKYGGYWTGPVDSGKYFSLDKEAGLYNLGYHYTDNYGCSAEGNMTISIYETSLDIDKSITSVCEDEKLPVSANYNGPGYMRWYVTSASDGFFKKGIFDPDNIYQMGNKDKLRQYLIVYAKSLDTFCNLLTDSHFVKINARPSAEFFYKQNSGQAPSSVEFMDFSSIAYDSITEYQWNFGDGSFSNLQNPVHLYQNPAYYDVILKVSSNKGCSDSLERKNLIYVYPVSVVENPWTKIRIYPNPANDQLTIESSENMDKVILYNFLGAKIREMDVNENKVTLNRDKLPSGLYLLKVFDIKGQVNVYQVVFK